MKFSKSIELEFYISKVGEDILKLSERAKFLIFHLYLCISFGYKWHSTYYEDCSDLFSRWNSKKSPVYYSWRVRQEWWWTGIYFDPFVIMSKHRASQRFGALCYVLSASHSSEKLYNFSPLKCTKWQQKNHNRNQT